MKTWAVPRSYWKIPENGLFWWYQVKNHTPQDLRQYVSLCISLQSISVCAPSFNSPCRVVIQWSDPRSAIWVPPAFLMPSMPFNVISLRMLVSTFLGRSTLPVPRRQISKTSRHQQHDLVGGFSPYPSEKWWSESQLGWLSHIMENITSFFLAPDATVPRWRHNYGLLCDQSYSPRSHSNVLPEPVAGTPSLWCKTLSTWSNP